MVETRVITYLVSIVALLGIGTFVFINNPKGKANRWLALYAVCVVMWIVSLNFADNFNDQGLAMISSKAAFAFGGPVFYCLYRFSGVFPKDKVKKSKIIDMLMIGLMSIFVIASPTALAVESVKIVGYGAEVTGGPLYLGLSVYILLAIFLTSMNFSRSYKSGTGTEKQQLRLLIIGFAITISFVLGTNLFLVLIGISDYGFLGPPSNIFFVVATAYAIIRHRLFDIRALVARSIAYLLSVGTIGALYGYIAFGLIGEFLTTRIFTNEVGRRSILSFLAVILAFTFPTIRRFFEKVTDRIFYRDKYDPQVLVADIGRILASEIELDPLSKKVTKVIETQMRLTDSNVVVLGKKHAEDGESESENEIFYQSSQGKGNQEYKMSDLNTIRLPVVMTDELAPSNEKDILESHHIRMALTLKTKESFVGYLLLGDKRSGDIYSDQDIQTLRIIANELAVAIQNARSYEEIQQFNKTLREKITQATADLSHANKELKALDKAKDEFISMASHQLRTPLTAVRGYTSMVMEGDFGKVSGEQKDTLRQSFDAATRMTRLVDDLLNVSRIQSGKFRLERTEVDLNKVLPEEISLIETTASSKSVSVTYHAPKTPVPTLMIDEGKTRQCLMNLMDNSIYYSSTTKGGGKVDVYLEADNNKVSFRVVDNGIGVPKDQQAKLFKKFYRAPNAQKTRPDGTGLGLFLVGKVVKDQGGEIIFASTEGKGSTFGFSLPIKPAGEDLVVIEKNSIAAEKSAVLAADAPAEK